MLRFQLFGFPVTIHWMFWLTAGMLGYPFAAMSGREGLMFWLIWIAIVFFSVLFHELGHAFAFRRYGQRPQIVLRAFGGYAQGTGMLTRREDIMVSLAGPLFGLVLFVVFYFLTPYVASSSSELGAKGWNFFLVWMIVANLFWSLVNLLPILPLDGGRVFAAVMAHHRNQRKIVPMVGMIVGGVVAAIGLTTGQFFLGIMFGMMAFSNWQRMQGVPPSF